jgi:hypothetical protein
MRSLTLAGTPLTILALLLLGSGNDITHAKTYVGPVAAPHTARIAFVIQNGKFLAYVCSGSDDFAGGTCASWLRGDIGKNGTFKIKNGAVILSGKLDGEVVTGTVTGAQGKDLFFRADVSTQANAGLFREQRPVNGREIVAGWIRDEQGEVVGSVNEAGANSTKVNGFGVTQSSEGPPFILHVPPQPAQDVAVQKVGDLISSGTRNNGGKKFPTGDVSQPKNNGGKKFSTGDVSQPKNNGGKKFPTSEQ